MSVLLTLMLAGAAQDPAASRYDNYLTPERLIEIASGRRLNLRCQGEGPVTVILEAGLGFPSLSWRAVHPELARRTRTCAYDRAGLGFSDPGRMPRTAGAAADDLEALLERAGLRPPYILVGSSLGGQVVRLFAFRHPDRVAGMVLVDPYAEGQYRVFANIEPAIGQELAQGAREEAACLAALRRRELSGEDAERRGCIAGPITGASPALNALLRRQGLSPAAFEAAASESAMLDTKNERQLAAARRPLGDMPLIVLSARGNFASPRYARTAERLRAAQTALHRRLAALSTAGEVRQVDAGHVIQTDNPDAVIRAVEDILERIRR
ncbi:MAG TPA: alpha/beta hydrolase [Allosphingosinicella sp.]|nr:alpha/beta hydrolase [Allosphingosinicella sp.]